MNGFFNLNDLDLSIDDGLPKMYEILEISQLLKLKIPKKFQKDSYRPTLTKELIAEIKPIADRYELEFKNEGFQPYSEIEIPVLSFFCKYEKV